MAIILATRTNVTLITISWSLSAIYFRKEKAKQPSITIFIYSQCILQMKKKLCINGTENLIILMYRDIFVERAQW